MGRKGNQAIILLLCLLVSCTKDKPTGRTNTVSSSQSGVYVICEGQYPRPDASLYLYKPASDSVFGDLYMGANGRPLGEVFESMAHIGNYFFLAVNNSNKVVVVTADGAKEVATISIPQPRYILPVDASRAYVSSLYSNKVFIINTQTFAITDSITLPSINSEGMCLVDNNAFIACWDTASQYIYKVDITTNHITQNIRVAGYAPSAIVADKNNLLWVMAGNQSYNKIPTLTHIDPSTGDMLGSFTFSAAVNPIKPAFNPAKDTLYFIEAAFSGGSANNGIFRIGINESSLPAHPFIVATANQYYWGLGIDPTSGLIYVGDPKGFNQSGSVSVYHADGSLKTSFAVGVGPGAFSFDN